MISDDDETDIATVQAFRLSSRLSSVASSSAVPDSISQTKDEEGSNKPPPKKQKSPTNKAKLLLAIREDSAIETSTSSLISPTSPHSSTSEWEIDAAKREIIKWQRKTRDAEDAALVMKKQMQDSLGQLVELEQRLQQQHQNFMDWHRQEMDSTVVQYEADLQSSRELATRLEAELNTSHEEVARLTQKLADSSEELIGTREQLQQQQQRHATIMLDLENRMGALERENQELTKQVFDQGQRKMELQSKLMMAEQDLEGVRSKHRELIARLRDLEEENQVLKRERYGHFQPMDSIPF